MKQVEKKLIELEDQLVKSCGDLRDLEAKLKRMMAETLVTKRCAKQLEENADAVLEAIEEARKTGVDLDTDAILEKLQKTIQEKPPAL